MGALNQEIKSFIEGITFLSKDVLHVYGGTFAFLLWIVLFRSTKKVVGLSLILLAAILNEILDGFYYWGKSGRIHWAESISDIFNTIFIPVALYFFLRYLLTRKDSI